MNKKYFVLVLTAIMTINFVQTIFCMEKKESIFNREKEEEIHNETQRATEEINSERVRHSEENFSWEDVVSNSKEIKNYMWKPDYSTQTTNINNDPKAGKSFWSRRVRDGDNLISTMFVNGGYALFENLCLRKIISAIEVRYFSTENDILVQDHNKNATNVNVYKKRLELISSEMQDIEEELEQTRNPKKIALLQADYRELNRARKVLNKKHREWRKNFTKTILQHKEHKAKQPKTIFESQNEELRKIQESPIKNNAPQQSTQSNDYENFLASIETDDNKLQEDNTDFLDDKTEAQELFTPEEHDSSKQEKIDEIFNQQPQEEILPSQNNEMTENLFNTNIAEQEKNSDEEPSLLFQPATVE